MEQISGFYEDLVVVGLSGVLMADINGAGEIITSTIANLKIETVDIGLPVRDIEIKYSLDSKRKIYAIHDFEAALLGGKVSFGDYNYSPVDEENGSAEKLLQLNINAIDIREILSQADYQGFEGSGKMSGLLPLKITAQGVSMSGGKLSAIPPGGIIRYQEAAANIAEVNPALELVSQALSNYHYDTLQADINYSRLGDLDLAVKMQGINPDMNKGQRINLNLNISDNIPVLLKSLQSSRVIADVLIKELQRQ